jgi:integrase
MARCVPPHTDAAVVADLQSRYKPGGVAVYVRNLRAFYNWALAEQIVSVNPFAKIRIAIPRETRSTPTDAEIDAMLRHAARNRRDLAILAMLADTGCRRGEIASLAESDVDLASGVVVFHVSKSQPRVVPLSVRAHRALGGYVRLLARSSSKKPGLWRSTDPSSVVRAVVARHSNNRLTPHALRRAFAVRWLRNGGSEVGLMRIAGWSSREMIALYTSACADELAHSEMRRLLTGLRGV